MPATLTIKDQRNIGTTDQTFTLEFPTERISVRELIRERVYQEVQDYNRKRTGFFRGLVQPTDAEAGLNGYKLKKLRDIDWKQQFDRAIEAFESSRILILVDDQQASSLDDDIEIKRGTEVTFLRLTPLVGG